MRHPSMKYTRWRLQLRSRLIWLPAAMLFFVLSAHAQTDVMLPPLGGPGGGQFVARCPQGQLLTGVELRTGDDVDAIKPICVAAYSTISVAELKPYPSTLAGANRQLVCTDRYTPPITIPLAPIVIGMYVRSEGKTEVVNNIHLFCGTAGPERGQSAEIQGAIIKNELEPPTVRFDGPPNDYPGRESTQQCPSNLVAVGIHGRSGIWLDAVSLICGVPTLTPKAAPEPGPVKAIGRVKGAPTGPPRPICVVAREARARNSPAAPGLEAQCRAAGAAGETSPTKALGRVKLPPGTTPNPPISICESARRARARNSPAAPGLEAQCRAAGAAGETPPQAAPTITADPNPVMVPNGQASGTTTITWKAAPDYTYCEIYLSVDNGEWSEFARGGDGAKSTTIKLGSSYTFSMMVYEGQEGTPKIIATLTVTLKN
jgi:hypothetical protein